MTKKDEVKIDALLANLWERSLPTIHERLDILDRAASAAASNALSEESRIEAVDAAHKLAGSLGMFGYAQCTEPARQIEQILSAPTPAASSRLGSLATALRQMLFPDARSV